MLEASGALNSWHDHLEPALPDPQVLINNAGVYGERLGFGEESMENMVSTFTANTAGPMVLIQELYGLGLLGGAAGPSLVAILTSKVRRLPAGWEPSMRPGRRGICSLDRGLAGCSRLQTGLAEGF